MADTIPGMDNAPAKPRRRFRFGLRTLLAVVTLAAVGSWGYWVVWPWWERYLEQIRFEAATKQVKVGVKLNAAMNFLPRHYAQGGIVPCGGWSLPPHPVQLCPAEQQFITFTSSV